MSVPQLLEIPSMINAITLLEQEARARRSRVMPARDAVDEHADDENARLADEYERAAEALRRLHNRGFSEGVLAGLKTLADSCKARREKKST